MIQRILAISNHGNMLGGGEYSFLDLLSHLPRHWDILVVVPQEGELAFKLRAKSIPVATLPLPALRPWLFHRTLNALRGYILIYKKYRPDLIYANGPRAVFYGGIPGRLMQIPAIWHCRVANQDSYLDWLLTRLSSRIIANSRATVRRFGPTLKDRVSVVHNGIDLQWLNEVTVGPAPLIQPDWKVILVVARISKWKRHDLALASFEEVGETIRDCHLVCLGAKDSNEPAWWEELQERSRCSPFSDRVHWIGKVDDVRPYYRAASVLLLPSDNEPFGRVLVEAMGSGLPVIATKGGGVPEIVRHGEDGLLVTPNSAGELTGALLRLLKDDNLRTRISETGRKRSETFSLHVHVERMVEIFEDTARHRARRPF